MSDTAEAKTETPEVKEEKPAATPIFGSGFSSAAGFGGFTGVTLPASTAAKAEEGDAEEGDAEEECKAEFKPLVQLEAVDTETGEEGETCIMESKCKMYRYDKDTQEWKERGVGMAKFLKNNESSKIRFLMRQDKTLKIRANQMAMPGTKITSHAGNEKAWVWTSVDFADEEQKIEMFAIRFGTIEKAAQFKEEYEKAMDANGKLLAADVAEGGEEVPAVKDEAKAAADSAADALADEVAKTDV